MRDAFVERALGLIDQGKTLLVHGSAPGQDLREWELRAMNVLAELAPAPYEELLLRDFPDDRTRRGAVLNALGAASEASPNPAEEAAVAVRATEIVERAAGRLNIEMPRSVRVASSTHYAGAKDAVSISRGHAHWPDEELTALAGHELGHKRQNRDDRDASEAYGVARNILTNAAKIILRDSESMPMRLRITTALTSASLQVSNALLAKTVGYQREFDADRAGAEATTPETMANALRRLEEIEVRERERRWRGKPWRERVADRVHEELARLTDDHPSFAARIERVLASQPEGSPTVGPATARLTRERSRSGTEDGAPSRDA